MSFTTVTSSLPPPFTHFCTILQRVPGTSKLLDSREISCTDLQFGSFCSPKTMEMFCCLLENKTLYCTTTFIPALLFSSEVFTSSLVELQWELEETNSDQSILKNCATKLSSTFTSGSHMYRMSHKSCTTQPIHITIS
jgi:hypothetical protein